MLFLLLLLWQLHQLLFLLVFFASGTVLSSGNKDLIIGAKEEASIGNHGKFDIAELIIFDQAINDERLSIMEGYLGHKWNLVNDLPSSHAYKTNPPLFENRPQILLPNPYFLRLGDEHNFTILTNRAADTFYANGLPPGLAFTESSGEIHGTTLTKGNFLTTVEATNAAGTFQTEIEFQVNDFNPWKYQLELNVTGYSNASVLRDFPLLVELNSSIQDFHYDQFAYTDGRDLRFLSEDKSRELAYEVVQWNPQGTSTFWVLLPELEEGCSIFAIWEVDGVGQLNKVIWRTYGKGITYNTGYLLIGRKMCFTMVTICHIFNQRICELIHLPNCPVVFPYRAVR